MQRGKQLQLTDGKGGLFTAEIILDNKKAAKVKVIAASGVVRQSSNITVAISLLKNSSRFEWFVEKATEIGVSSIVPLVCARTEKQHFHSGRIKTILVSAMLQSQQAWLPLLDEPVLFKEFIKRQGHQRKYIAHCIDGEKKKLADQPAVENNDQLVLIGPEGDFTNEEVNIALQNNFIPVSLGDTRLRTETAGIAACVLLNAAKKGV